MKKDFISIKDINLFEMEKIFHLTTKVKANPERFSTRLKGKTLGLVFQKPSNRTRVSFEVGMYQLGGYPLYLGLDDIKLGVREATKDIAATLSRYLSAIVARTFHHQDIIDLANNAAIPVINGLTDLLHPCQAMADIFTIKEKVPQEKIRLAFVGDGNNVLHSLLYGCSKTGIDLSISTPEGYGPDSAILNDAKEEAKINGSAIEFFSDSKDAVKDADIIYTDVWASMGQEAEYEKRKKDFEGFQVNSDLIKEAKPDCLIMHCLPAHRGEEITDEVIDGPNSIVFDQAENRMHIQKAILLMLLG